MEITPNVIMDLLPLYLAGEASADTRALVEAYLDNNPQMARLAELARETGLPQEAAPAPLSEEDEMKSFKKAKRLMFQHNLFLILAITFTFFFAMGTNFLLDESPQGVVVFFLIAGIFWFLFWRVNKQLSE